MPRPSGSGDPPWKGLSGDRRIQREFRALEKLIDAGGCPQVSDLDVVDDCLRKWQFKLKRFDDDVTGGRQLNVDLSQLAERHGQDHLLMEVSFPEDYPQQPFFIRVITPRCRWYTGHITAGGSVCIEALTLSGSSSSWQPDYCVESMLNVVISNMIDCESVLVETPTGPGGLSGPLRIDLEQKYTWNVMAPYTEEEARSAFRRMEANHNKFGWGSVSSSKGGTSGLRNDTLVGQSGASTAVGGQSKAGQPGQGPVGAPLCKDAARSKCENRDMEFRSKRTSSSTALAGSPLATVAHALDKSSNLTPTPAHGTGACKRHDPASGLSLEGNPKKRPRVCGSGDGVAALISGEDGMQQEAPGSSATDLECSALISQWMKLSLCDEPTPAGSLLAGGDGDHVILCENRVLKKQVERLQRQLSDLSSKPHLGLPPPHWKHINNSQDHPVQYIDLYRYGAGSSAHRMDVDLKYEDIRTMTAQGVSLEDAVAALRECGGDADAAAGFVIGSLERGGAAAVVRARDKTTSSAVEEMELDDVLNRFEEDSFLTREHVVCVQRVQSMKLWGRYCLRKAEIADVSGAKNVNVELLWHGADVKTLEIITREGFDHRVSNLNGVLGAGIYFSECSELSHLYSALGPHSACPQALTPPATLSQSTTGAQTCTAVFQHVLPNPQATPVSSSPITTQVVVPTEKKAEDAPVYAMLLCQVALGRMTQGSSGLRRPPSGFDSVYGCTRPRKDGETTYMFAVFDNAQAYPEYLVYYQ